MSANNTDTTTNTNVYLDQIFNTTIKKKKKKDTTNKMQEHVLWAAVWTAAD